MYFYISIFLLFILILWICGYESLYMTPRRTTNVYTLTPTKRLSSLTELAQMWYQPIGYILNPEFGPFISEKQLYQ